MKEIITEIIKKATAGTQLFLVGMAVQKNKVEIYIDGDAGVSLEDCALLNRNLHVELEKANVDAGEFVVEISSPGIDREIEGVRSFKKNVGRGLRVRNRQNRYLSGKMAFVGPDGIILVPNGQKKKTEYMKYSDIEEAKAVI